MAASQYLSGPDFRWRIVGGPVDFTFDMPGSPPGQRKWRGRRAQILCSNREQVSFAALGPWGMQITIQIRPGPQQHNMIDQVELILANPQTLYTLYQPGKVARTVTLDPDQTVNDRQENGSTFYTFGLMANSAAPPSTGEITLPNSGNPMVFGAPLSMVAPTVPDTISMAVGWDNIPNPTAMDAVILNPRASMVHTTAITSFYTSAATHGSGIMRILGGETPGEYRLRLLLGNYLGGLALIDGPDVDLL